MIVSDDLVQHALDFLRASALEIGQAKAEMMRTGHRLKVVKALVMKQHTAMSAAKAEVEAYASGEYEAAIEEEMQAVIAYESLKARREAASATIEAWRSEQATYRTMKI